jgi:hypothetical protein
MPRYTQILSDRAERQSGDGAQTSPFEIDPYIAFFAVFTALRAVFFTARVGLSAPTRRAVFFTACFAPFVTFFFETICRHSSIVTVGESGHPCGAYQIGEAPSARHPRSSL